MKRTYFSILTTVALLGALPIKAVAQTTPTFSRMAFGAVEAVWRGLESCGLQRMSAYDPRLPRPRVPADYAIATPRLELLSYYHEDFFGVFPRLVFKNPNGGMVHFVMYNSEMILFQTPLEGVEAQAIRYVTPEGPAIRYLCGGKNVNFQEFEGCVNTHFVSIITKQLCRFGKPNP